MDCWAMNADGPAAARRGGGVRGREGREEREEHEEQEGGYHTE